MPSKRKKEYYSERSSSSDDEDTPTKKVRSKRQSVEQCVVYEDEILNNNDLDAPRLTDSEAHWYKPDVNVKSRQYCHFSYKFEPHQFIRCHCNEEENEGSSVQLWDAAFEPGKPNVIATCGGRYLCVLDVDTGELLLKYTHNHVMEIFYTLAWSQLEWGNILVTGSNFGEIRLFDLARGVSFHSWTYRKGVSINAVVFKDDNPNHLFTASSDCSVNLWNIGQPSPPLFEDVDFTNVLRVQCPGEEIDIYSMAYIRHSSWILVGSTDGLFGSLTSNPSDYSKSMAGSLMTEFKIPGRVINNFQYPWIDSVCSLGNNLVAAKRINQGKIIIFSPPLEENEDQRFIDVIVLAELAWRKTENFYMNIGGCSESGMLACGDDKGYVWVYKLPSWMITDNEEKERNILSNCPIKMAPIGIVPWPVIEDGNANGSRTKDVIIDKVTLSANGKHIVAVTNNNLVAMWKKSCK